MMEGEATGGAPLAVSPVVTSTMDSQTFDAMSQALIDAGIMSQEEVAVERAAMEAGDGSQATPVLTPMHNGQTTTLDDVAFAGAISPMEYNFGNLTPPHGSVTDPDYQAFEYGLRHSLHEAGIPPGVGNEFARLIYQSLAKPMDATAIELERRSTIGQLSKMWGNDFDRNLAAANAVIDSMGQGAPLMKQVLQNGLGNNAWLIASMFNIAQARGLVR